MLPRQPAGGARGLSGCRMKFGLLRKIKYALFILFVCLLIGLFYLTSSGLPSTAVRRIESYLQFSGMVLSLDRIKLSPFEGIVATDVKYYRRGDIGEPVVQADRLVIILDPFFKLRGGMVVSGVIVKNGRVRLPLEALSLDPGGGGKAPDIALDSISAKVRFNRRDSLQIENLSTTVAGLRVTGHGVIVVSNQSAQPVGGNYDGAGVTNGRVGVNPAAAKILRALNEFASGSTATVDVEFFVDPGNLEKLSLKISGNGHNVRCAEIDCQAWNAHVTVEGRKAYGRFILHNAEYGGVRLQSANCTAHLDENGLLDVAVKSVPGQSAPSGTLDLRLKYNLVTEKFEGSATTGCDLHGFVPLLRRQKLKLADIFQDLDFKRMPPAGELSFEGGFKPAFTCRLKGDVLGDTFDYKGVPNLLIKLGLDAEFRDAGDRVRIRPMMIVRDEGLVRGAMEYKSSDNTISFSALSMADPGAVARMIDPVIASAVAPYTFDGLCYASVFGTVGLTNSMLNNMEVNVNAGSARWKMFTLSPCALTMHIVERSYRIEDFNGSIFNGTIRGSAEIDPAAADSSNMIFAVTAKVDNVDFGILVNNLAGKKLEGAYEGACAASVSLQGMLDDPQTIVGGGWLRIDDGRIFTVPIFSGLFDMIGKLLPGNWNFNGKNNARADITVADGKVSTRNLFIEGDVISVKGSGDCYLDGRLDFKIQITFMRRQSLIGNLVQVVTLPITKAFQFHLGGTVSAPKWETTYLPF